MVELPTPTNAPGAALPGSAEWLSTHLTGLGFGCKHLQKYSIRNEQSELVFPSRLGFFYNATEGNVRISFLDTKKLCNNCLALVVPDGYNCWLTRMCPPTGPQSDSFPLLQLNASPSSDNFPLFFQAGTEGLFDLHGVPRATVKLGLQTTAPVVVPMPQLPGLKEAWDWIQYQRKPFYIDQLHLTKGWNTLAQRAAERDCIIAQKHGLTYVPVVHATCPKPTPDASHPADRRVPRADKPTKDAPTNERRVTIKPPHRDEPTKAPESDNSLPKTSTKISIEKPPKVEKPVSKSLLNSPTISGQTKFTNAPIASFGDVTTALLTNAAVKARPKKPKSDTNAVHVVGPKEIVNQDFPSREVRSQSSKCTTKVVKNEHPTLDNNAVQDARKPLSMKNWCRHGPIPFDNPIPTPKLSDFMRRAEVADEETRSVAHLPLRHMRGKATKIDDSAPLAGPGSTAATVGSKIFLALRGKKGSKKGSATPVASSKFIESTIQASSVEAVRQHRKKKSKMHNSDRKVPKSAKEKPTQGTLKKEKSMVTKVTKVKSIDPSPHKLSKSPKRKIKKAPSQKKPKHHGRSHHKKKEHGYESESEVSDGPGTLKILGTAIKDEVQEVKDRIKEKLDNHNRKKKKNPTKYSDSDETDGLSSDDWNEVDYQNLDDQDPSNQDPNDDQAPKDQRSDNQNLEDQTPEDEDLVDQDQINQTPSNQNSGDQNSDHQNPDSQNLHNQIPGSQNPRDQNPDPRNSGNHKLNNENLVDHPLGDQNSNDQSPNDQQLPVSLDDQCPHSQNPGSQPPEDQNLDDNNPDPQTLKGSRKEDGFGEANATEKGQRMSHRQHAGDEHKPENGGTDFDQYGFANQGRTPSPTQGQGAKVSTPLQPPDHELRPQGETPVSDTPSRSASTENTALEASQRVEYSTSTAENTFDGDQKGDTLPRLSSKEFEKGSIPPQSSKDNRSTQAPTAPGLTPNRNLVSAGETRETPLSHGSKVNITSSKPDKHLISNKNNPPVATAAVAVSLTVGAGVVATSGLLDEGQGTDPDPASLTTNGAVDSSVYDSDADNYTHNHVDLNTSDNIDDEAGDPYHYYFESDKNRDFDSYQYSESRDDNNETSFNGIDTNTFDAFINPKEDSDNDSEYESNVPNYDKSDPDSESDNQEKALDSDNSHNDSEDEGNAPHYDGCDSDSDTGSNDSEEGEFFNDHDDFNNDNEGLGQYPDDTSNNGSSDDDSDDENGLTGYNSENEDNKSEEEDNEVEEEDYEDEGDKEEEEVEEEEYEGEEEEEVEEEYESEEEDEGEEEQYESEEEDEGEEEQYESEEEYDVDEEGVEGEEEEYGVEEDEVEWGEREEDCSENEYSKVSGYED